MSGSTAIPKALKNFAKATYEMVGKVFFGVIYRGSTVVGVGKGFTESVKQLSGCIQDGAEAISDTVKRLSDAFPDPILSRIASAETPTSESAATGESRNGCTSHTSTYSRPKPAEKKKTVVAQPEEDTQNGPIPGDASSDAVDWSTCEESAGEDDGTLEFPCGEYDMPEDDEDMFYPPDDDEEFHDEPFETF